MAIDPFLMRKAALGGKPATVAPEQPAPAAPATSAPATTKATQPVVVKKVSSATPATSAVSKPKVNPLITAHKVEKAAPAPSVEVTGPGEVSQTVKVMEEEPPMNFQERLDRLDSLIQSDLGIGPFTVDVIRSHVKLLMVELKENPELDSVLIDRDVHNILRFIRSVRDMALGEMTEKKAKREVKAVKSSRVGKIKIDPAAFADLPDFSQGTPASLQALAKVKT